MKILVIEDEIELARSIKEILQSQNYVSELAGDYNIAIDKITMFEYDCILLDLSLPGGNGLDVLRKLKASGKSNGVIIISARNSIDDKVLGLNLGADDYLPKPFHMAELIARVQAVVRRKRFDGNDIIEFEEIKVDTSAKTITVHEMVLTTTRKEFDLLLFLLSNRNRVVSKEAIAAHLTGDQADYMDNFDFIYTHIKNIKRKLSDAGSLDYIKTIYGLGYKISR